MNKKEFKLFRLCVYVSLIVEYLYLLFFGKINCPGCPLCGMTRAIKNILLFNFKEALNLNHFSWIFMIIIPLILIDMLYIFNSYKNKNDL